MVDLGFLLISFFVFTAELNRPGAMRLNMPADGVPTALADSDAMTVLLDKNNRIYYYFGDWKKAFAANAIYQTAYSGERSLRHTIIAKQKALSASGRKEGKDGLMLLIKASGNARYENIVDVLDEMTINVVKKYAIVKITAEETEWLRQRERL